MSSKDEEISSWREPNNRGSYGSTSSTLSPVSSQLSGITAQSLLHLDNTFFNNFDELNEKNNDDEDNITAISQICKSPSSKRQKNDNNVQRVEPTEFEILSVINSSFIHELSANYGRNAINSQLDDSFYGLPQKVKYLFKKYKGIDELYAWQQECLNLEAIKTRKNLIYSLPTSGGKTLVAEILMLRELVRNKKNVIFVLPYVAIVQEKVQSMSTFGLDMGFLIEEYAAGKGAYPIKKRRKKNSIYICTIEKALGVVNYLIEENRLDEIGTVVVDELHLLGDNGGRGATLEGLLTKIMFVNAKIHIIGMSATIGNSKEIAKFLNADLYEDNFRPVQIHEYVKCNSEMCKIDKKSEEIFTSKEVKAYPYYSKEALTIDPDCIGGLVNEIVPNDSCLIFCSNRKGCENVAKLLTKVLFRNLLEHNKEAKQYLESALGQEGRICPVLRKTIRFGVAYHHSGLTAEERKLIEDAFRSGTLCVICCTSTLAAGVNLPARRVLLRSPYIGTEFLNTSRYKQMIGRAGRAGMNEIGESIVICKAEDIPKIRTLVTAKIEDILSSLHTEQDRGLNNLILSSVLLKIATTKARLKMLIDRSLMKLQEKRLCIKIDEILERTINGLLEKEILIATNNSGTKLDLKECQEINDDTELDLSPLGKAAMKACIDLPVAYDLYDDLKEAQRSVILDDTLHLLYLVTPYDLTKVVNPSGSVYSEVVIKLDKYQMNIARRIGITEASICKLMSGLLPKDVPERIVKRFYITLMLQELWQRKSVHDVADKYQVNRGTIQFLLTSAATFASSVVRFCDNLPEFWTVKDLVTTFSRRLEYCCPEELEPLMQLPYVQLVRARQLYKAGFQTVTSIANATPQELVKQISYLPRQTAVQIIAAANLLIIEIVETCRDKAAEAQEGLIHRGDLSFLFDDSFE
ncbi:helicase POLQ-like isoform X1 [Leptopilina heterotoma]|uniref:helicase POLQ-like isoform X1 n=1 Tax=Leptopilina heterotoma TaxID=63436 RepID=UPI001CA982CA|nr:helicase POLQ-like isoform X1 [Leptopilina heterotoma]